MDNALVQRTSEWLEMRRNYIGASDAPIIMGVNKFKVADGRVKDIGMLWEEKLNIKTYGCNNSQTQYGIRNEEKARDVYERITHNVMLPKVVFHPTYSFMMASLDGLALDEEIFVEIKNCNASDHELAKQGKVPDHYYPQVQHQLACTGLQTMHYFSFHKNEGVIVEVKRNDEYITQLIEKEKQFWKCVQEKTPPEVEVRWKKMDTSIETKAKQIYGLKNQIKIAQEEAQKLLDEIIQEAEGMSIYGEEFSVIQKVRQGSINYSLIPELQNKDLNIYRSDPLTYWVVKKNP